MRVPLTATAVAVQAFDADGRSMGETPLRGDERDGGGLPGETPQTRLVD